MLKGYVMVRYAAGAAAARTGDEMSGPALMLAALAATGSAASGASLLAGIMVSAAVGGPLFGVLLDRSARPGRLLGGALAVYALALVVILGCLGRIPFGAVAGIAVFAGVLGPALSGGWTSQLPRVVPPDALPRANALDAMTFDLASLAGPALAGTVALAPVGYRDEITDSGDPRVGDGHPDRVPGPAQPPAGDTGGGSCPLRPLL